MEYLVYSGEETETLAKGLSLWLKPGWSVLLKGELGSGKSVIARAMIRALAADPDLEVPSPTFSLMQVYDETRVPVVHADLYRLKSETDVAELGLADMRASHALIVEWPELAATALTGGDTLVVSLTGSGSGRRLVLEPHGKWQRALERNAEIEQFLAQARPQPLARTFLQGDASTRRYEIITAPSTCELLMDMPRQPDGPPVKDGKPYSQIVHLAESIHAVAAVNNRLLALGYSAPAITAIDAGRGLALIERLDGELHGDMVARGADMRPPLKAAVEVLADMALQDWPRDVPAPEGRVHHLADYEPAAQMFEADLLVSWFIPEVTGKAVSAALRQSYQDLWRSILPLAQPSSPHWVLRDYHSPNLIWMPQREGLRRTGLIDTQDAVMGHPAYDLVSLLQDARVDVAEHLHDELYRYYCELRASRGPFDRGAFDAAYAVLGAQRASKLLGLFVRLLRRDGKPGYMRHIPRQKRYMQRNTANPALESLRQWLDRHVPESLQE